MLVEAVDKPMCYRWPEDEVKLMPGHPIDLPESRALRLLQKAPGKVRVVCQEPLSASRPGCLVTWQGADGKLREPATVDFLHADSDGTLWAFYTLLDGNWGAVNMKYVTLRSEGGPDGR